MTKNLFSLPSQLMLPHRIHSLTPCLTKILPTVHHVQKRDANTKPWKKGPIENWQKGIHDYTYRWARAKKFAKIQLPDFDEERDVKNAMDPERVRSLMKKAGVLPHRSWDEKPMVLTCTQDIGDAFKPPVEEEVFSSTVLARKAKDMATKAFLKVYRRPISKIRDYLGDFDPVIFAQTEATEIYTKAHETLAKMASSTDMEYNEDEILKYVTEKALPDMLFRADKKSIQWKFLQNLEEPKVVHAVVMPGINPGVKFGQITVRMHSQQMLAVYDRFGRLIFGSSHAVKDVLEYVVFENYLSNKYGIWRLHGKIIPDQTMEKRTPILNTIKLKEVDREVNNEVQENSQVAHV